MNIHAPSEKLLNASWDNDSDNYCQDAKGIYEGGFIAALNLCIPILEKVQEDYRGLATTAGRHGLYATKKDALETADYIKQFLEGEIYDQQRKR